MEGGPYEKRKLSAMKSHLFDCAKGGRRRNISLFGNIESGYALRSSLNLSRKAIGPRVILLVSWKRLQRNDCGLETTATRMKKVREISEYKASCEAFGNSRTQE